MTARSSKKMQSALIGLVRERVGSHIPREIPHAP
jgi:hypothetical protein